MPVTRERVDPQRDHSDLGLVHRRWIVPDDVQRPMPLPNLTRLWRGLMDLRVLDAAAEVRLERFNGETIELPAAASAGALLAGTGAATLVTQVVWTDEDGRCDPYALDGEPDPEGFRDYTLYAIDVPGRVLLPIAPVARLCAVCGRRVDIRLPRFGEGVLLDLDEPVCTCSARPDLARDKVELRNGAVFLLEEISCRAALSIELPRAPESEELPDAQVAALIREVLGGTDELADDAVPPAD
ncbi:MAG: hypothetical protein E6J65_24505 [Deltaproteobacteria bacterium]|nr:MAG: hypothetical protein E6J63_19720 [Deltaproteobacteria bacterium]TMB13912.1 MAG: hypothetical protein E6J65_24505 [Deltaproteobacteria bacterium]